MTSSSTRPRRWRPKHDSQFGDGADRERLAGAAGSRRVPRPCWPPAQGQRLGEMSDADLRRSYNHYQPNDPRDPNDDRPVVEWVGGNTYEHYAEHIGWIDQLVRESRAER